MKKVISLLLVATMLTAMLAVSFNALSVSDVDDEGVPFVKSFREGITEYEEENEMEPGSLPTQRIYFMMPNGKNGPVATDDINLHHPEVIDAETGEVTQEAYDEIVIHKGDKAPSWYNENNILDGKHYAGVYWWGGPAEVDGKWCGYRMEIESEEQGIFYADIPYDPDDPSASVTVAIFNNGVDGGTDTSKPIYYQAAQTVDTNVEGAWVGDYDSLSYGSPDASSFDNCIYVIDPNQVSINAFSQKQTCGANWYVYYGNGCYGEEFKEGVGDDNEYPDGTPGWSEDVADMCKNPDHFKDGVHVGYQPPVDEPTVHVHTPAAAVRENVVPATCTAEGSYDEVVKCSVCGEEISRTKKTIEKIAHTPGAPIAENVKPASCIAEGSYTEIVYCSVCSEELSRTEKTIEKTPHNLTYVPIVAATEEADGVKAHYVCDECNKLFSDAAGTVEVTMADLVIPKTDHQHVLQFKPGKKATTTADGWKSYFYCKTCGKYFNNNAGEIELTWDQIVIPKIVPTEPPTEAPKPTEAPTDPPKPTEAPTEAPKPTDPPKGFLGDADGDGTVTVYDVTVIQRAEVGIIKTTDSMTLCGDVDGDGQLTIFDATFIQRWLNKVTVRYNIGDPIY